MAEAMVKGDPERTGVMEKSLRGKLVEFRSRAPESCCASTHVDAAVERLEVHAYTIPTDEPESDGTLEWDSTTIVVVEAHAGGKTGLGYTYCDAAAAELVSSQLAGVVEGADAMDVRAAWLRMTRASATRAGRGSASAPSPRSTRRSGTSRRACSSVPLVVLLGAAHDDVPIYGSGGFCSYSRRAAARAARRLGRGRDPAREDEGRPRAGARPGAPRRAPARRSATTSSSSSTRTARFARKEALALGGALRATWDVTLVRGARLLRRPRRPAR